MDILATQVWLHHLRPISKVDGGTMNNNRIIVAAFLNAVFVGSLIGVTVSLIFGVLYLVLQ